MGWKKAVVAGAGALTSLSADESLNQPDEQAIPVTNNDSSRRGRTGTSRSVVTESTSSTGIEPISSSVKESIVDKNRTDESDDIVGENLDIASSAPIVIVEKLKKGKKVPPTPLKESLLIPDVDEQLSIRVVEDEEEQVLEGDLNDDGDNMKKKTRKNDDVAVVIETQKINRQKDDHRALKEQQEKARRDAQSLAQVQGHALSASQVISTSTTTTGVGPTSSTSTISRGVITPAVDTININQENDAILANIPKAMYLSDAWCLHGKRVCKCAICSDCGHGKMKSNCKLCSDCGHGKLKGKCSDCSNCGHGKIKSKCGMCSNCGHGKIKSKCNICYNCGHDRIKSRCAICSGDCGHGKIKAQCSVCSNCGHGKIRTNCSICNDCGHGKRKGKCRTCREFQT